jgi:hypothetical protein
MVKRSDKGERKHKRGASSEEIARDHVEIHLLLLQTVCVEKRWF